MKYKLYNFVGSAEPIGAYYIDEQSRMISFVFDPANTDAQQFAKWLQSGNKPDPAEEGGVVTDEWIAETIAKLLP